MSTAGGMTAVTTAPQDHEEHGMPPRGTSLQGEVTRSPYS